MDNSFLREFLEKCNITYSKFKKNMTRKMKVCIWVLAERTPVPHQYTHLANLQNRFTN